MILHDHPSGFGQLQGILEFGGCPARIEQNERRSEKKQGMDKCSTVLEIRVNSKISLLRNLSLNLTEELWLMIAIISAFSALKDLSSAVAPRTTSGKYRKNLEGLEGLFVK